MDGKGILSRAFALTAPALMSFSILTAESVCLQHHTQTDCCKANRIAAYEHVPCYLHRHEERTGNDFSFGSRMTNATTIPSGVQFGTIPNYVSPADWAHSRTSYVRDGLIHESSFIDNKYPESNEFTVARLILNGNPIRIKHEV